MTQSGKAILFLVFSIFFGFVANAQNLFDAENSKKFARYLFSTQQYKLAATEYERILNSNQSDAVIYENLLETYRLGNICENSFQILNALNINYLIKTKSVANEYLKLSLTCNCCFSQSLFTKALTSVNYNSQLFYKLSYYLFTEKQDSLSKITYHNYEALKNNYPVILSDIEKLETFKRKSPVLAASMSAILPGSGKAYSGYWGDAIMSFVFVSTNAWLSYRGFNKNNVKSTSGWIFGSISLGFYLGNIWGSSRTAKTYNRIEYEKLYNEAKNNIYNHF